MIAGCVWFYTKKNIIAVFHVQIVEVCVWYKAIFNEYFCYTYTQKYSCNIISLNTTFVSFFFLLNM